MSPGNESISLSPTPVASSTKDMGKALVNPENQTGSLVPLVKNAHGKVRKIMNHKDVALFLGYYSSTREEVSQKSSGIAGVLSLGCCFKVNGGFLATSLVESGVSELAVFGVRVALSSCFGFSSWRLSSSLSFDHSNSEFILWSFVWWPFLCS
ncbi:unnamed protein product [Amaranthus hypochondriacus]